MDQRWGAETGNAWQPPQQQPQRDFLAEATRLALQLDPVSWDFDLSEGDLSRGLETCDAQQIHLHNTVLPTGTVMTQEVTNAGTQNMCSLYKPQPAAGVDCQPLFFEPTPRPTEASSLSGSEAEWAPETHSSKHTKPEPSKAKIKDKGRTSQRRLRQRLKDKRVEQKRTRESFDQELEKLKQEKAAVEAHVEVLEKALMKLSKENLAAPPQTEEIPPFVPSMGWIAFNPRGSVVLSAVFDQPKTLTPKEAGMISLKDIARLWMEYVIKTEGYLKKIEEAKEGDNEYSLKLKALLDERHGFIAWTSANNVFMVHKLNSSNIEVESPMHWKHASKSPRDILAKLDFSEKQKSALVECRNQYLSSIGFHSAALAQVQKKLMKLDPSPQESLRNSPYVTWQELSRSLQNSIEEIHLSWVRLHFEIYHGEHALSAYQAGQLLVECFPYLPDFIMLMRKLELTENAPSSQEVLKAGALKFSSTAETPSNKDGVEVHKTVVDKMSELIGKVSLWA